MNDYKLNIGDLLVFKSENVSYTCLGLGSCIGLFLQDRITGLSGGAHILLPDALNTTLTSNDKFYSARQAIAELIRQFKLKGSNANNLRAKIVGGANVIASGCDTGKRNTEVVIEELLMHKVYIAAMDVGGSRSRSAKFDGKTGTLTVRIPETKELKIY